MWVGFWVVALAPSPKLQLQAVGLPVERSVKSTERGAVPESGVPLKSAAGPGGAVDRAPVATRAYPCGPCGTARARTVTDQVPASGVAIRICSTLLSGSGLPPGVDWPAPVLKTLPR